VSVVRVNRCVSLESETRLARVQLVSLDVGAAGVTTTIRDDGIVEREGEGLVEAREGARCVSRDGRCGKREATIVVTLDAGAGRILLNALRLARLSGAAVQ
jgi:hypothetical protein